jgi:Ca-activated chloride channel family protein
MRTDTMASARVAAAAALLALAARPVSADATSHLKEKTLASIRVEGLASTTPGVDLDVEPRTGRVTLKIPAREFADMLAPGVRPGRLRVREDGVPQRASVDVQHAPVSVGVLIEMGGRSRQLADVLESEVPSLVRPLLDRLGPEDRLGLFSYDRELRTLLDFGAPPDTWAASLDRLEPPVFSEANFYDATLAVLERMQAQPGRRAVILLTTGIDTFSHASFADLQARARALGTPIYLLTLGDLVQHRVFTQDTGPLARVDWDAVERRCRDLAKASGGRAYPRVRTLSAPAIYDDVLERLRITYVLSYVSPRLAADARQPRVVEVRLAPPAIASSRPA